MTNNEQDSLTAKPDGKPFSRSFDFSLDFEKINFKKRPELYRIGRGEDGVLLVEPYTSEISPFWKFEDEAQAIESSTKIFELFQDYLEKNDFVGADMARKFLLMGYTRARRYAHHKKGSQKTGRKNKGVTSTVKVELNEAITVEKQPRSTEDQVKAAVAKIFKDKSDQAKLNPKYIELKEKFNEIIRED
ncbi:DUF4385 domain-containing protein [Acinetobacter sp. ANC 4779]|uniref:DUF4385 domain-containing protein n=1 Tax=Acinetobacter sp. ANC 4779 TaxID=2529848 RepID=UPI00103E8307|nr:DUF4385 domain-containing protein [Acinetobacter sp. ANC 4779]TCB51513.1 DUF4385 domain-containing protein [Acinetobacter sp. ANC 4779]